MSAVRLQPRVVGGEAGFASEDPLSPGGIVRHSDAKQSVPDYLRLQVGEQQRARTTLIPRIIQD